VSQRNYVFYAAIVLFASTVLFMWYSSRDRGRTKAEPLATLTVVTNAEYQPFTFINERDEIVGFDIDVAREVARRLGKDVTFIDRPFDALIAELQTGRAQLAAAGLSPSPERLLLVLFTKPYFAGDPLVIITRAESEPRMTVNDLHGARVVVNEGFTADYYVSALSDVDITRLATVSDAFLALKSGRVDVFVSAYSSVKPFLKMQGNERYRVVPLEQTEEQYALAVSRKHEKLLSPVQEALDEMMRDGTIGQLKKKWNLSND